MTDFQKQVIKAIEENQPSLLKMIDNRLIVETKATNLARCWAGAENRNKSL